MDFAEADVPPSKALLSGPHTPTKSERSTEAARKTKYIVLSLVLLVIGSVCLAQSFKALSSNSKPPSSSLATPSIPKPPDVRGGRNQIPLGLGDARSLPLPDVGSRVGPAARQEAAAARAKPVMLYDVREEQASSRRLAAPSRSRAGSALPRREQRRSGNSDMWQAAGSISLPPTRDGLDLEAIKAQINQRLAEQAAEEKPLFGTHHTRVSVHASSVSQTGGGREAGLVTDGEVGGVGEDSSNSTTSRRSRRGRRSSLRPTAPSDRCNRNIKDLVRYFKARVGRDAFVTQEFVPTLSGKERFSLEHRKMLPLDSGAIQKDYKFGRCAVVGNSGHLRLTRFGANINTFDVVMRTNQAPTKGYAKFVGTKTTFRLINRSITKTYRRAMSHFKRTNPPARRLLAQPLEDDGELRHAARTLQTKGASYPLEPNVTMILIFEAKSRVTDTVQFTRTIRPMRPDVKVLVSSGKLRRASEGLLIEWTKRQRACIGRDTGRNNQNRGTTGLLAVTTMLQLCKRVTVYGFGQPRNGTSAAGYHYYSGLNSRTWRSKSSSVHNFPGEASVIRNMVNQGVIEVCNEDSPKICGLGRSKINELAKKFKTRVKVVEGKPWLPDHVQLEDAEEDEDYEGLDVTDEELAEQEKDEEKEEKDAQSEGFEPEEPLDVLDI